MMMTTSFLRWCDVDPARHAFEPERIRAIATEVLSRDRLREVANRENLIEAIDLALIAELGAWISGWHWDLSYGGPVRLASNLGTTRDPLAVVSAVADWQAFLVQVAELIDECRSEPVEHVASRVLPIIVGRTGCDDAWYGTFARTLGWCLEASGHDPEQIEPLIRAVVKSRFGSWIEPDPGVARQVFVAIGRDVATARPLSERDALGEWLAIRGAAFVGLAAENPERPTLTHDGHRQFIHGPERARDAARADAMDVALDACRASAAPLDFESLSGWQSIVLGEPAPFRTTDAFAKGGRERYRVDGARERFDACLAESNDPAVPIAIRAARVYLDVCFFHPFADGNARAARLALDHLLTGEGLGVASAEPLFVISRAANDKRGAWCLAYVVEALLGRLDGLR